MTDSATRARITHTPSSIRRAVAIIGCSSAKTSTRDGGCRRGGRRIRTLQQNLGFPTFHGILYHAPHPSRLSWGVWGGGRTCRAEPLGQQPPDAGADLGPAEVVLVQRFDLRQGGDLVHRAGRVHHGRAGPHAGHGGGGSTGEIGREGGGEMEEEERTQNRRGEGGRRTLREADASN